MVGAKEASIGHDVSMDVNSLILQSADALVAKQNADGAFPAGHNGPYFDEELPIRNTAHALILMLKAYSLSKNDVYYEVAEKALGYIVDDKRRPMGATFWCRKNPRKDFANGLIGQAWVIEALVYAYKYFKQDRVMELALSTFRLHPFVRARGVWQIVNVDGSWGAVDRAFNHQLWFAAVGGWLRDDPQVDAQITKFFDSLETNLGVYENGLIIHGLSPQRRLRVRLRDALGFRRGDAYKNRVINKAIGYHAFNTYGFALLFQNYSQHAFWRSEKFKRILGFIDSPLFRDGLEYFAPEAKMDGGALTHNRYGYAYNPPGIEVAYTLQVFKDLFSSSQRASARDWLSRQVDKTFDKDAGLMLLNTHDKATLAARIYELTRLEHIVINE